MIITCDSNILTVASRDNDNHSRTVTSKINKINVVKIPPHSTEFATSEQTNKSDIRQKILSWRDREGTDRDIDDELKNENKL